MTTTTEVIPSSVAATEPKRRVTRRPEAVLIASSAGTSVINYGYTMLMIWLLPARIYAVFGSVASLLLLCGTIASASTPWVLAQETAQSATGSDRRARAVAFGLFSVTLQGLLAGVATAAVASHYASGPIVAVVLGSSVAIFVEAAGIGYLQGLERFGIIAVLRLLEVGSKVAVGVVLVEFGGGAGGAVGGFLFGAALVTMVTVLAMRSDLRWVPGVLRDRHLWLSSRGLLGIQAGVAVLAGMDIVIASLTIATRGTLATYQAAQILGRIPIFVAGALSLVLFTRLARAGSSRAHRAEHAVSLLIAVCVPVAFVVGTFPHTFTSLLFPSRYGDVQRVLPLVAAAGVTMGFVELLSTVFQALRQFEPAILVIWAGVLVGIPAEWVSVRVDGIIGLAWASMATGGAVTLALLVACRALWGVALARVLLSTARAVTVGLPLILLHRWAVLWSAYVALVVLPAVCLRLWRHEAAGRVKSGRPVVLHLGFEDPARPGSGGGSVRTHEINRRIAQRMDVTVVCAAYPGCRARVEDGVRYVHIGWRGGGNLALMSYFAALPYALARYRSDLVVEDFAAPLSSVAVPWFTSRPVIGIVQWLFAAEKARQYHLPFGLVERIGLASHRTLVTVSQDLGTELRRRNRRASVTVIENGLRDDAFADDGSPRSGIGFIGRLEIAQKGIDLLLEAFARAAPRIDQNLLIAGDGPDRDRILALIDKLGLAERVRLVGRVGAAERGRWLSRVDLVVVPSRYETFGLVAAEALAAGTPVVAFDIPCLRNLVTPTVGVVATPFDVTDLAAAIETLATDESRRRALGERAPGSVDHLRWHDLAAAQLAVYRATLSSTGHRSKNEEKPCRAGPGPRMRRTDRSTR